MQLSVLSSSISALDQAQLAQHKNRKKLWLTLFALSTLLAVYQTASALYSYFRPSISMSESEEMIDIGSVWTLCFNNRADYEDADNKTIEILLKMKNVSSSCDLIRPSLFCLSLLSQSDRFLIGHPVKDFLGKDVKAAGCWLTEYDVKRYFNHLYYGNCVTMGILNRYRYLQVNYNYKAMKVKSKPPVLVIHEMDTPPTFNSDSVIYVMYELNSWSADSACVDSETASLQSWTTFDEHRNIYSNKYIYSYQSCLDQCVHELTKTYCNCILPKSMINSNEERLPLCSTICNKIPNNELSNMCGCKPSCTHVKFTWTEMSHASENDESIFSEIIKQWKHIEWEGGESKPLTVDNLLLVRKKYSLGLTCQGAGYFKSFAMSVSYVRSSVKLEDALSTVGGVWGIWLGLSVSVLLSLGLRTINRFKKPKPIRTHRKKNQSPSKANHDYSKRIHLTLHWSGVVIIASVYIWQTYLTVNEYFKFEVVNVVTTEPQDYNSFLDVFVCSETAVHPSNETLQNDSNLAWRVAVLTYLTKNKDNFWMDKFYKLNFTSEEKLKLLPSVDDFIKDCHFLTDAGKTIPCAIEERKLFTSNETNGKGWPSSIPRTCAAITPRYPEFDMVKIQKLKIHVQCPRADAFDQILLTTVFFDVLSLLSVFNTLRPVEALSVAPGSRNVLTFSQTETRRLAHPYTSKCIPSDTPYPVWPKNIKDFGASINYSYTFKDCLHLCLKNLIDARAACKPYTSSKLCNLDPSVCGCHYPCTATEYHFKMSEVQNAYKQRVSYGHYDSIDELIDYMWWGESVVEIERESMYKTVVAEKPAIEDDSLVGILGGISGLWIGQSILNLIVEIQMILAFFFTKIISLKNG